MSDSPLSRAEDAKHNRDFAAEIGILTTTNADLESQPWYPLKPGDVVLMSTADGEIGETYLAQPDEFDYDGPALELLRVSTLGDDGAPEGWSVTFYDLWFEAGPSMLVVIRAGVVVHGAPLIRVESPGPVALPLNRSDN